MIFPAPPLNLTRTAGCAQPSLGTTGIQESAPSPIFTTIAVLFNVMLLKSGQVAIFGIRNDL
jgi:hypothetical protein